MWSGYARRSVAWREREQQQEKRHSQTLPGGEPDAGAAAAAAAAADDDDDDAGGGVSKPHASKTQASLRPSSRHQSSTTTKKKSTTSSASLKAGRGGGCGGDGGGGATGPLAAAAPAEEGPQRSVHARAHAQVQPSPRPPPWNAAAGSAAAGPTITLPLTINLSMTQGETSQLTNDSMFLPCASLGSGGGGAAESKENEPGDAKGRGSLRSSATNTPLGLGQQSLASDSRKSLASCSRVPLGQKSLSSGSQATTSRSQSQPQRAALPTATLHPELGGGPSDCARRKLEAWLGQPPKMEQERAGRASIWKRAEDANSEADSNFLAAMRPPRSPPSLLFDPEQRAYPRYNRWKRATPPAPAPTAARQQLLLLLPPSKAGPTPADGVFKEHADPARQTLETELVQASEELKAEASRARKELEAGAEAALENQRTQFDTQLREVQRLLDEARQTGHALRDDLHKEHSKAKSSLKNLIDHGLNTVHGTFRSKMKEIKNELLKEILPFTEKYCEKWLAMFRTQEKLKEEVEPVGEKRGSSSSNVSALVHPTPSNRKGTQAFSSPPSTSGAAKDGSYSRNAGDGHSKLSRPEDRAGKSSCHQTASTASNRKHFSSSPKTVSTRSLTPTESKSRAKTAPSKGSTPGHKPVKSRLGNTTESQDQPIHPNRAKAAAKRPALTPLRFTTRCSMKKSPPVQPPTNTPMRPSQNKLLGQVKRPREMVSEASLPPRKKRATRRPRGILRFSPSDDECAAFL